MEPSISHRLIHVIHNYAVCTHYTLTYNLYVCYSDIVRANIILISVS